MAKSCVYSTHRLQRLWAVTMSKQIKTVKEGVLYYFKINIPAFE